uniref:Uncharacterized protein n=1 Tax=Molossus molossus TaxID=27622 RepID=A0A7J8HHQ2_MOLMO|nr:hypothetical protein HJG59_010950 [Molossus molossus]
MRRRDFHAEASPVSFSHLSTHSIATCPMPGRELPGGRWLLLTSLHCTVGTLLDLPLPETSQGGLLSLGSYPDPSTSPTPAAPGRRGCMFQSSSQFLSEPQFLSEVGVENISGHRFWVLPLCQALY